MKANHNILFIAPALALSLHLSSPGASAEILLSEDFSSGDGAFTVSNENHDNPWVYNAALGTWSTDGSANGAANEHTRLTSPVLTSAVDGDYQLSFDHRYDIEGGRWDGGAVFTSVNGGPFTQIPNSLFSRNGYNAINLIGAHALLGSDGFGGISPGHAAGTFITSIAGPISLSAGDTFQIQLLMANDQGAVGTSTPNWEIDSITINTLTDNDGDGIPNDVEDQFAFLDRDDPSDAELDEDSDGLSNREEFEAATILDNPDSDGDTLLDGVETDTGIWVSASDRGTNPLDPDSDDDGLSDGVENHDLPYDSQNPETQPGSDPNIANTDGDPAADALEVQFNTDPTDPTRFPAFTEFLEFRYEFDTEGVGPLIDTSGKGLDVLATPSNGPPHRFGEPSLVGGAGFSIGLDAPGTNHSTGSYLLVRDPPHPDTFSFSIWIKPSKPGQQNPIFSRENVWWPSPGVFYSLFVSGSGSLVWITGQTQNIETDPGLIADGEIHHIVVTHMDSGGRGDFQTDRGRLYVNGVMVAEFENPTEVPPLEGNMDGNEIYRSIWFGTKSAGPGYKGEFDDFQMYSTELTEEQVAEMYASPGTIANFGPPPAFEITSISAAENAQSQVDVTLTWRSKNNQSYAIDSFDPRTGQWGEVTDGVAAEEGGSTAFTFTEFNDGPTIYYRVRVEE